MSYVEGFVIPVPTERKAAYKAFAERLAPIFKKHGALSIRECWGEDIPEGETTSFPLSVKLKETETVVFSWIIWPSKEVRTSGNEAVMEEMNKTMDETESQFFDGKRMIYGGFESLVEA